MWLPLFSRSYGINHEFSFSMHKGTNEYRIFRTFCFNYLFFCFFFHKNMIIINFFSANSKHEFNVCVHITFIYGSFSSGLTPMERLEMQSKSGDPEAKIVRTPPKWILDGMWRQCQHIDATILAFGKICRSLMTNKAQWEMFRHTEEVFNAMSTSFKDRGG